MEHRRPSDERIAAEAAEWFLQLRDEQSKGVDPAAFAEWLTRSPTHVQEFLEVSTLWSTLGGRGSRRYDPEDLIAAARAEQAQRRVVPLVAQRAEISLEGRGASRRDTRRVVVGIAASLLVGLAVWGGIALSRRGSEFTTAVGEQRSITLPDGTVLFLNTNSQVRVRLGRQHRDIDLIRGEARFQVARNPQRPFVVVTADATIRALGTVFNVAMAKEGTQVAVLEGRVELRERVPSDAQPPLSAVGSASSTGTADIGRTRQTRLELAAGERAAVTSEGIEPEVGPSIESVKAWTEHRLVVRDKTLAEVVDEFNRYRPQRLVIDDPGLAGLRISGTFDPSDPDSLVAYLGAVEAVQVSTPTDGNVHLSRGHK
jgi:transmembrane sensor